VFTIGPFSRLSGVSARILRIYERLELFRPVWSDPGSGYRYYSPAQLPELRRIIALRTVGLGLHEIGQLVNDGADLGMALQRRRTELRRERREVERRLAALEIELAGAGAGEAGLGVVVRPLAGEAVATIALDEPDEIEGAFYELEAYVRDHGRRAHRPPGALLGPSEVDADRKGEPQERIEIFVPVTGQLERSGRIGYRRLPACRAATLIEQGGYGGVPRARAELERWVKRAGYAPVGPTRIIYLQFGAEPELKVPRGYVVERSSDYLTEIQVPVT
jgi:DNA-binding transcriptional MerR regulator